jgi:hypothetical protein
MTLRLGEEITCEGCHTTVNPFVVDMFHADNENYSTALVRCPLCDVTTEIDRPIDADSD